ncbi:MAG: YecA family protein [Planctomycetota bacterium]
MSDAQYTGLVAELLTKGDPREWEDWPNYLDMGFTQEHVPALIEMATDADLNFAPSDSLRVWAPVHAWRTLTQMKAKEAIKPLLLLFHFMPDNEWVDELHEFYDAMGREAIGPFDEVWDMYGPESQMQIISCLQVIIENHDDAHEECRSFARARLAQHADNDPGINGWLIAILMNLDDKTSIGLIREAFRARDVLHDVAGDLLTIEKELGVPPDENFPYLDTMPERSSWLDVPEEEDDEDEEVEVEPARRMSEKIGRNDPCPCGSGKKYKKCCLLKVQ